MKASKLLKQIDKAITAAHTERRRSYLGMSSLGQSCSRKAWLQWRWAKTETFSPRILRLFNRGNLEEPRFVKYLQQAGYEVEDIDEKTGQQFEFVSCDGHVKGHCDGKVRIKSKEYVVEMKTHNDKSFNALQRTSSVESSKLEHYYQMQRYMEAMGLKQALYMAVNKNTDALYLEFVKYNKTAVEYLLVKERNLVRTLSAPVGVSDNATYWMCNFCTFQDICHYNTPVDRTCRMCMHGIPVKNGKWLCNKYEKQLTYKDQLNGCNNGFQVL